DMRPRRRCPWCRYRVLQLRMPSWFYLRGTRVLDADTSIRPLRIWIMPAFCDAGRQEKAARDQGPGISGHDAGNFALCAACGTVRGVLLWRWDGRQTAAGEHVGEEPNQLLMN